MIQTITVINHKNETLILTLDRPELSGLIVQKAEGLGPAKAQINTTNLSSIDGSLFSSSRVGERNIVLSLIMTESPTVEAARLRTYQYFQIKKQVRIRVKTDARNAEVVGYVESCEPDIFSKQEAVQVSIICPDPNFYEYYGQETVFSGIKPLFEFPFSNESLTAKLIEFGQILLDTRAILHYVGDIDTGVIITAHALGPANNLIIFNTDTYEQMKVDTSKIQALTGMGFSTGDDIIISTVKGDKYARLLRDGVYTNVISAIDKNSAWFQISAGDNIFAFTADDGEAQLMLTFTYRNAYGGV